MRPNHNYAAVFRQFSGESPGAAFRPGKRTALHVLALAVALVVMLAVPHADDPRQAVAPNQQAGGTWPALDLAALAPLPGYAFAQVQDDQPPTFASSGFNTATGVLTITFSEDIDVTPAANVVAARIHVRESGTYTGGITLTAGELGTAADASTISFTLTGPRLETVKGLAAPELTIDPGAVRDTSGNLIVSTFDVSTATFADVTFSVFDQDTVPTGMAFSNDGAKMFVVGSFGADIHEYTLTTPFDITTAAHARSFNVTEQDTFPTGVAFSNDGAKMFVVGNDGNDINEYTLTTPFNVSTAAFAFACHLLRLGPGHETRRHGVFKRRRQDVRGRS